MPLPPKRLHCARCLRPQSACICAWIHPVEHATEVLFLQHPLEVRNAKGSAQLLHLSLPRSRLVVGETFDQDELRALLFEPFASSDGKTSDCMIRPVLLYPDDAMQQVGTLNTEESPFIRHRLIVIDGTWRKSRKMLHLNPLLQKLPRMALRNPPASHYLIRKAHRPDQLSTYEATCFALIELEDGADKYRPLFDAFDGFVAQQQTYADARHKPD